MTLPASVPDDSPARLDVVSPPALRLALEVSVVRAGIRRCAGCGRRRVCLAARVTGGGTPIIESPPECRECTGLLAR